MSGDFQGRPRGCSVDSKSGRPTVDALISTAYSLSLVFASFCRAAILRIAARPAFLPAISLVS
jgi:hypothetical protein